MTFAPVDFEVKDLLKDLQGRMVGPKVARTPRRRADEPVGRGRRRRAGGVAAEGVPIARVAPDSPAAAAGVKPGDVLTALDGRWTTSLADTYDAAAAVPAGQPVPVVVLRDGQRLTLTVTPRTGSEPRAAPLACFNAQAIF